MSGTTRFGPMYPTIPHMATYPPRAAPKSTEGGRIVLQVSIILRGGNNRSRCCFGSIPVAYLRLGAARSTAAQKPKRPSRSIENFVAKLFDDRVREDFPSDTLDLGLCFFAGQAVEFENEEFSLAYVLDFGVAK